MDDSAIKQIQEHVTLDILATTLNTKDTHSTTVAVPNGFKIQDLEEFMPERSSYRVNYDTISMKAFVDYCNLEMGEDTKCFIDTDEMRAVTYFDLGTKEKPLHQRHTAVLSPKMTAAYKALIYLCSDRCSNQKASAEFIEDWSNHLCITGDDNESMANSTASQAVRNITVSRMKSKRSSISSFSEDSDIMERAEAKSDNNPMPSIFIFSCAPYLDFNVRHFIVEMSINVDEAHDRIGLKFRIVKHDLVQEEIGEEFLDTLNNKFDPEISSFIGSI